MAMVQGKQTQENARQVINTRSGIEALEERATLCHLSRILLDIIDALYHHLSTTSSL
jgi:hypothetical protein